MRIKRRKSRVVKIGSVSIGGSHPVLIQSMAKARTSDVQGVLKQIEGMARLGCSTVRVAVKDNADAAAIKRIKGQAKVNLIADIHFHYKLALLSLENGADKIRLNPGNIYKRDEVGEVVRLAKDRKVPIRVGLNSGSVARVKSDRSISDSMVKAALKYIRLINSFGFDDIVVSLKASSVMETVAAYRMIAPVCGYPLHLGVTASGLPQDGAVKSALGIGVLLSEGIGDTIRVSLTAAPEEEIALSQRILQALGMQERRVEVISCPTCGRCSVDLAEIVRQVEKGLGGPARGAKGRHSKIAVMGCVVNGPGEAKQADIGIAFGADSAMLFEKGRFVKKVSKQGCVKELLKRVQ